MSESARSLGGVQAGPNAWSTRQIARVFFTLAALAAFLYVLYRVRSVLELVLVVDRLRASLGKGSGTVSVGDEVAVEASLTFGFIDP